MDTTSQFWKSRGRLVGLLSEVAELEHALCCAYLFAAFSMKNHVDERGVTWAQVELLRQWKGQLLFIARQEMEHLAIACNLLTALGELPYFKRPNFPTGKVFYPVGLALDLRTFSLPTVARFLLFELPAPLEDGSENPQVTALLAELSKAPSRMNRWLARQVVGKRKDGSRTLGETYAEITDLIHQLGDRLLVGPPDAQVDNRLFKPAGSTLREDMYGIAVKAVKSLDDAKASIQQVRTAGEGAPAGPQAQGGHFSRFVEMYLAMSAAHRAPGQFSPGRAVVRNPIPMGTPFRRGTTEVTHPVTSEAVAVCDLGYEILLRMLLRIFAQTDQGDKEVEALKAAAFFPLMTAVVRPLGEVLTLMPATQGGDGKVAGSAFQSPRRVDFLPHGPAAWRVLHGQLLELRGRLEALSKVKDREIGEPIRARLAMAYENVWRIAFNFATELDLPHKP